MDEWNALVEKCQIIQLDVDITAAEHTFRQRTAESVRKAFHTSRQLDYLRKQAEAHTPSRIMGPGSPHKHEHAVADTLERAKSGFSTNRQAVLNYMPKLEAVLRSNLAVFAERAARLLLRIDQFVAKDNQAFNYTAQQTATETFLHDFPNVTGGGEPFESDDETVEAVAPLPACALRATVAPWWTLPVDRDARAAACATARAAARAARIEAECAPLRAAVIAPWWKTPPDTACGTAPDTACGTAQDTACGTAPDTACGTAPDTACGTAPDTACGTAPNAQDTAVTAKRCRVYPLVFAGTASLVNQPVRAGKLYETAAPGTGTLLVQRGEEFAVFDIQQFLTLRSVSR